MIYHSPGAAALMSLSDALRTAAASARAVHYAGIGARNLDGHAAELLAPAKARGALITCDLIAPGPDSAAELRRLLPHVDVFMPSAVEARVRHRRRKRSAAGGARLARLGRRRHRDQERRGRRARPG